MEFAKKGNLGVFTNMVSASRVPLHLRNQKGNVLLKGVGNIAGMDVLNVMLLTNKNVELV